MPSIYRFNFYWDEYAFNKLEALNKAVAQASMSESCNLESRSYALSCRSDLEAEINSVTSDDEFKEKLQQAVDQ